MRKIGGGDQPEGDVGVALSSVQGSGVELDASLVQVGAQRLPLALDPLEVALGPKHEVIARVLA